MIFRFQAKFSSAKDNQFSEKAQEPLLMQRCSYEILLLATLARRIHAWLESYKL